MWPGICRVHHAALLQLRGDWATAEEEARRACAELDGIHVPNVAAAFVEIGEIRRRLGDLEGAEEAFARAEVLSGRQAVGMALLRLAQGRVDAATTIITGMLSRTGANRLARGKLLPARVQIAVAAGDFDAAGDAADELDRIAADAASPMLTAAARSARGRLELARGDAGSACATLREAVELWLELEVPYEVATAHLLLSRAARSHGDDDTATRSLQAATAIFERLGAVIEAGNPPEPASAAPLPAGLTAREAEVLSLVASGRTNKEIAAALYLSERTVARHLSNIFTKVGVTSRTAAAAFAFERGIAQPAPSGRG
jgi:DNA-binding CsgD family transcriptional regulator